MPVEDSTQQEEWRPVVGAVGSYEVSSLGRVRSLDRSVTVSGSHRAGHFRQLSGRMLSPVGDGYGYVVVRVGSRKRIRVQYLVAAAFIGPRPPGKHVCHNDGDRGNNMVTNLRYDTPKGNASDRIKHDTHTRGTRHPLSKLTDAGVREARILSARGVSLSSLAKRNGVSKATIRSAIVGRSWAWLDA